MSTAISKVAFSALSGKRVFVDYVKVEAQVPVVGPVSVAGFPKPVGNVYTYPVTGLQSAHNYYYTVEPVGNSGSVSNQVAVRTNLTTDIVNGLHANWKQTVVSGGVKLVQLQPGSSVRLLNLSGVIFFSANCTSATFFIPIATHGFYLLQAEHQPFCKFLY
jgi:hypothetical protein